MNTLKKIILTICITTIAFSCSNESVEVTEETNSFSKTYTDLARESIKLSTNEESSIIVKNIIDDEISLKLQSFLDSQRKSNQMITTNTSLVEINGSLIKLSSASFTSNTLEKNRNTIKSIIHMTDDMNLDSMLEIEMIDIGNNQYEVISQKEIQEYQSRSCYGSYSVACTDTNGDGEVSYGECFGACLGYGLSTEGLVGVVIIGAGASGVVCPPCGIAASILTGIIALGCAGGCA